MGSVKLCIVQFINALYKMTHLWQSFSDEFADIYLQKLSTEFIQAAFACVTNWKAVDTLHRWVCI
jgi:hypothetical protein